MSISLFCNEFFTISIIDLAPPFRLWAVLQCALFDTEIYQVCWLHVKVHSYSGVLASKSGVASIT
jgi:hypothetical protein